jgi:hypothetical protein
MNRFNRFLETGEKPGEEGKPDATGGTKGKGKGKAKEDSWIETLRAHQIEPGKRDTASTAPRHTFEVGFIFLPVELIS